VAAARNTHFVGGLEIEVVGWTGPLAVPEETTPYTVTADFYGLSEGDCRNRLQRLVLAAALRFDFITLVAAGDTNVGSRP
jgi:hypothetical protein